MDKPTDHIACISYSNGWRAYDIHYTTQKLFHNVTTGSTYWLLSDEDHTDWHALRAYQDAERKKGELCRDTEQPSSWLLRDYKVTQEGKDEPDTLFSFDRDMMTELVQIYVCPPNGGYARGKFTNFRWRAGYPKGGSNAI